jgi:hypothetical protein
MQWSWLVGEAPCERRLAGRASKGSDAGQHFVQHAAQRVDVAPTIDLPHGAPLLRTHVSRRAERHPRLGDLSIARYTKGSGDPEVADVRVGTRKQDVARLDIPMHEAVPMRVVQRICHLAPDSQRVCQRESPLAKQTVPDGFPLHVGHYVVEQAGCLSGVMEGKDVRVGEPRLDSDLTQEALAPERGRDPRMEHLDGYQTMVPEIFRQVHRAHAPAAELALDHVAVA